MLVGIMSDSHGRHIAVRKAIALFDSLGAGHLIHCGDIGGPRVFDELIGRSFSFVWGNMDFADDGVAEYLHSMGLATPEKPPVRLEFDGKTIAVFHGHEPEFVSAIRQMDVDYILHGHTHVARDEQFNGKRVVNPGALFRANPKTVATLDTQTGAVEFHEIKGI